MNVIEFQTPAPCCLLPITHPARKYVQARETDIRETLARNVPVMVVEIVESDKDD